MDFLFISIAGVWKNRFLAIGHDFPNKTFSRLILIDTFLFHMFRLSVRGQEDRIGNLKSLYLTAKIFFCDEKKFRMVYTGILAEFVRICKSFCTKRQLFSVVQIFCESSGISCFRIADSNGIFLQ